MFFYFLQQQQQNLSCFWFIKLKHAYWRIFEKQRKIERLWLSLILSLWSYSWVHFIHSTVIITHLSCKLLCIPGGQRKWKRQDPWPCKLDFIGEPNTEIIKHMTFSSCITFHHLHMFEVWLTLFFISFIYFIKPNRTSLH